MTDHPSALVSVPVEPTEAMLDAWHKATWPQGPRVSPLSQQGLSFARAYRAMLAAAPAAPQAAGVGEREAIARIMDPKGWETRDRQYDAIKRSTMHDKDRPLAFANADYYTRDSLTKADAILALRAPSREPEGGAVRELLREAGKQFRTYEAHHRAKKTNEAYEKAEINARLAERIEAALATREEAPAEAGEPSLVDWFSQFIERHQGGCGSDTDSLIACLDRVRDSYRAQPQACEDALPVAKVVSAHGDPEAFGEREIKVLQDLSRTPYDTPLYTHPTPYALRIAIEALAPFARLDVLEPSGVIIGLERYHFERVRQALAALQAEQVAK